MKKLVIGVSIALAVVAGLWYWSRSLSDRNRAWRELPTKYGWYYHARDSSASPAFASENIDCLLEFREYYKKIDQTGQAFVPPCFDFVVDYEVPVHIIEEYDSLTVKVVYFYITQHGREKYRVGYALKSTLQDSPYHGKKR